MILKLIFCNIIVRVFCLCRKICWAIPFFKFFISHITDTLLIIEYLFLNIFTRDLMKITILFQMNWVFSCMTSASFSSKKWCILQFYTKNFFMLYKIDKGGLYSLISTQVNQVARTVLSKCQENNSNVLFIVKSIISVGFMQF